MHFKCSEATAVATIQDGENMEHFHYHGKVLLDSADYYYRDYTDIAQVKHPKHLLILVPFSINC